MNRPALLLAALLWGMPAAALAKSHDWHDGPIPFIIITPFVLAIGYVIGLCLTRPPR